MSIRKFILATIICIQFIVPIAGQSPIIISEFMAINDSVIFDADGESSDWIELFNQGDSVINLENWVLTDNPDSLLKWTFPSIVINPGEYLLLFASGKDRVDSTVYLHSNFKLEGSGEYLALLDTSGNIMSEFVPSFPAQLADVSYGLFNNEYVFFTDPSPGEANASSAGVMIEPPVFSHERGFFQEAFLLEIAPGITGGEVYFTTDGTEPLIGEDQLYDGPVSINGTSIIRAMTALNGRPGISETHTYLFLDEVIHQPNDPEGYPALWGPYTAYDGNAIADYEMDPELVNESGYEDLLVQALIELPTISLVSDRDNFFSHDTDPETGGIYIYTGPPIDRVINGLGDGWERPVSFEYFDPSGEHSVQVNCGVRLQGGHSRRPEKSPKHSFRLVFRSEFGPTRFHYPILGDDAVDEFNTLTLRAGFNNTWLHSDESQRLRYQGARDGWAKDTQREIGWNSGHTDYAHLYINGIYWGIYQPAERMDKTFGEAYYGGDEDDYDVIKDYQQVVDGESTAWDHMMEKAEEGLVDNEDYFYLQGRAADGTNIPSLEPLVNVNSLIDYMLLNFYGGNTDWDHHNWAAIRNRVKPGEGYEFLSWDGEHIMESRSTNVLDENNSYCPSGLFQRMRENQEFLRTFQNRVAIHCYNDGALTPEANTTRWMQRKEIVEDAIYAEAARWGDYRRDVHRTGGDYDLYRKDPYWYSAEDYLLNDYFPARTSRLISQLRSANLFPDADPPSIYLNGELPDSSLINPGAILSMEVDQGTIYYTKNGTDPVLWPGSPGNEELTEAILSEDTQVYSGQFPLQNSAYIVARTLEDQEWSAASEYSFIVATDYDAVKITEIYYHPYHEDSTLIRALEFLELKNIGEHTLNMGGAAFVEGINYTFPENTAFKNGDFLVLASDDEMFYEFNGFAAFDQYKGQLDNSGEYLTLLDPLGDTISHFMYSNTALWPQEAAGLGRSMVPVELNPTGDPQAPASWRSSLYDFGSPGRDDVEIDTTTIDTSTIDTTGMGSLLAEIRQEIKLEQSYPNPFWNQANIVFSIPVQADVELTVYNLLGQKVETLLSGPQLPGRHLVHWELNEAERNSQTAMYIYRLRVRVYGQDLFYSGKMVRMQH